MKVFFCKNFLLWIKYGVPKVERNKFENVVIGIESECSSGRRILVCDRKSSDAFSDKIVI